MKGDPKSVKDLLKGTRLDRKKAEGTPNKHTISALINEIKAIDRVIETIKNLDKQNQKLEKTNIGLQKAALFLGFIVTFFTASQTIKMLFDLLPTFNLLISLGITLIIARIITDWLKEGW